MSLKKRKKVLLVDGYIREHEKSLTLSNVIPKSIISIIFEFQLLFEAWDKTISNRYAVISDDGSSFVMESISMHFSPAIIGTRIIKFGESFEWRLKILKATNKCDVYIGLVPNKKDLMCHYEGGPGWMSRGGLIWMAKSGCRCYNDSIKSWSNIELFGKEGDVLQIKFIWDEISTLNYIINGEDLGNMLLTEDGQIAKIKCEQDVGFRLGISAYFWGQYVKIMVE